MPFLSAQTLHIVDRLLWMAPFATASDLNEACRKADVSHVDRNDFLTMMLDEHSAPGSREQLRRLWSQWVTEKYPTSAAEEDANSGEKKGNNSVQTPEGSETEEAEEGN